MNEKDYQASCAGMPITGSIRCLSKTLLEACKYFSSKAIDSSDDSEIIYANTACILCSTSSLEALINEWISISTNLIKEDELTFFWRNLESLVKKLSITEKWDLIASHCNSTPWDNGHEPFQSFSLITSLRNELVHYKGTFLGKDETPTKKIESIMAKFGVKSKATYIGDDVSSWLDDLLEVKGLASWIYDNILYFHDNIFDLLITKP